MIIENISWSKVHNNIEVCISKIICGTYHSLMLSSNGNVYCFGVNDYGQCGDGTNEDKTEPIKVDIEIKFTDIGATKYYDISVGLAENGFCYVWGKCGEQSFIKPMKVPFTTINDVLEFYSSTKVIFKSLLFKKNSLICQNQTIFDRISEKFDKREYSDISFKIEDKYIFAQKTHLINVCKHFEVMLSEKNWIESNQNVIEIKDYSYSVYYAFIRYLYTNCVDVTHEESIALLDLANCYLDEELKKRCVEIIKNQITNKNIIAMYFSVVKYGSEELKEYCIE